MKNWMMPVFRSVCLCVAAYALGMALSPKPLLFAGGLVLLVEVCFTSRD